MTSHAQSKGKVVVSSILFWYPLAGVTYQVLHYMEGLRRLGFDPYYIEDSGRWIYDPALNDMSPDPVPNLKAVVPVLERHGFGERWAFRGRYPEGQSYGLDGAAIDRLYGDCAAFLNVTGAQELYEEHARCPVKIYVQSDPFAAQVKAELGDTDTLKSLRDHDLLFSFGENIGAPDCLVPTAGFTWLPTRQPVVMEFWPVREPRADAPFNTITTWSNKGKNVEWRGSTWYWTKDREFEQMIELPRRCPDAAFELAVRAPPEVEARLRASGWRLADSVAASETSDAYRDYISDGRGEFTVARDQYTRPRTGWFSDRTACYLAAGRPVITQSTAFEKFLPTGRGLFGFSTLEDAAQAVETIAADYPDHCKGARAVAEEFFRAETVVGSLMARAGL